MEGRLRAAFLHAPPVGAVDNGTAVNRSGHRMCLFPAVLCALVRAMLGLPRRAFATKGGLMLRKLVFGAAVAALAVATPALALPFTFSTGDPDLAMGTASRPATPGVIETESADDFVLTERTSITGAGFFGLLSGGARVSDVGSVVLEIYRVFPLDSTVPASGQVPTRTNSPSDNALLSRSGADLAFSVGDLAADVTVLNSVGAGIHPIPGETTGGDGPIRGTEVLIQAALSNPIVLDPGHYFFVPQVGMDDPAFAFYWLSAPRPIVGGTGPFVPDLQSWIRNENLAPDWLRVGTVMVGGSPAPTFNAAFALTGDTVTSVPEPDGRLLVGAALALLVLMRRRAQG
jgi:hypothetical protein